MWKEVLNMQFWCFECKWRILRKMPLLRSRESRKRTHLSNSMLFQNGEWEKSVVIENVIRHILFFRVPYVWFQNNVFIYLPNFFRNLQSTIELTSWTIFRTRKSEVVTLTFMRLGAWISKINLGRLYMYNTIMNRRHLSF